MAKYTIIVTSEFKKKQYFCSRKNGGCTQKSEKKSGKMDKNLRMWNNIRNFAE